MLCRNIKRGFGNATLVSTEDGKQYIFCQKVKSDYQRDVTGVDEVDGQGYYLPANVETKVKAMISSGEAQEFVNDGSLAGPLNEI